MRAGRLTADKHIIYSLRYFEEWEWLTDVLCGAILSPHPEIYISDVAHVSAACYPQSKGIENPPQSTFTAL